MTQEKKKTKRGTDSENTGQGQRDRGYGRQKRTPTHTKSQREERRENDRSIEQGGGGVEIMTERRKLQDIKRDRKLSEDMDRRGGERQ